MSREKEKEELRKRLAELEKDETAASYAEPVARTRSIGKPGKASRLVPILFGVIVVLIALLAARTLDFGNILSFGSVEEQKGAFVERLQESKELVTAEAYTKAVIEIEDNEIFGFTIDWNIPGTRREILMIFPGTVRAGIDLTGLTENDVDLNEEEKTATITVPQPTILGEATIHMDQVQAFSNEGLFRDNLELDETFEKSAEAQQMMKDEAELQGLLTLAQNNAEQTLQEMFQLTGYNVTIEFEE